MHGGMIWQQFFCEIAALTGHSLIKKEVREKYVFPQSDNLVLDFNCFARWIILHAFFLI